MKKKSITQSQLSQGNRNQDEERKNYLFRVTHLLNDRQFQEDFNSTETTSQLEPFGEHHVAVSISTVS